MLQLNLPSYNYQLEQRDGKLAIFDSIRKKYVVLTPEEWVRQHFAHLLNDRLGYPRSLTSIEQGIQYNGMTKRVDIMVSSNDLSPLVLVECKAPDITINEATLKQISVYNYSCRAPLVVLTNGMVTYAGHCGNTSEDFQVLKEIPTYQELNRIS